jgi:hypothetical protein
VDAVAGSYRGAIDPLGTGLRSPPLGPPQLPCKSLRHEAIPQGYSLVRGDRHLHPAWMHAWRLRGLTECPFRYIHQWPKSLRRGAAEGAIPLPQHARRWRDRKPEGHAMAMTEARQQIRAELWTHYRVFCMAGTETYRAGKSPAGESYGG